MKIKINQVRTAAIEFLASNPFGWVVLGIGAVITATTTIVKINKKIDEHREKIKEVGETARSEIESLKSELDKLSSSADKAMDTYSKLMDGVNTLNNTNLSLSDEEYAEFISSSNELADLFPELVVGLDREGNKILDLGSNAEEATSKVNDLIEAQRKLVAEETERNLVDVFKGINEETRDASNELESYRKNLDYFKNINFNELITGWQGLSGGKNISLSDSYIDGLDSEVLMNNMAKVINDSLGTDLRPEFLDLTNEWFLDLTSLTEEQYEDAIKALYLNSDLLEDKIVELVEGSISKAKEEINKSYKQELSSIFTALSDDVDYTSLSNTEKQLADALISGLDYSEYKDEIKSNYNGDIVKFLNSEILDSLYNASNEDKAEINKIYSELLSIDPDASLSDNIKVIEQYINDLAEILDIDSEKLKIMLGYEITDEDKERIKQAKIKATGSTTVDARDARSGSEKAKVQHAIDELSSDDITLFLNADISDETKFDTVDEFESFMDSLRKEAKIDVEVEIADITSPLSDIKEAYSSFESIFNEIESGATVSASSIDDLTDKFGEINGGESLENFKEVLTTVPDDIDACKEALNQLATDYLDQSDLIQNLTDDNAKYTESELKKLGVENAHEVVQSRLIQHDYTETDAKAVLVNYANQLTDAKEKERIASLDLTNATAQEIAKIIEEANAAGISTTALQRWLLEKMQTNKITISTNGDIQNLMSLVSALGSATTYIQKYAEAKAKLANGGTLTGNATADRYALDALEKGAQKELQDALNGATNANVNYTGGGISTGSGSGSGSSSASEAKETEKQYDWIAVAIKRVQEAIARLTKVRDNSYTGWSKRNTALNSEISEITKEISLQQQAYDGYMANANAVGLSQDYINKIQNGTIVIEDITDEGLQEQIDQYQEW